ncbi:hypothetical protein CORAM0001_0951 [Corynebacterium amycolatum SK46]|nr:hypothetical protein CORAM0001_0951 [Corynebacterium amycolatum SK46]
MLGDELLARSARHFFICIELLTAFMVGIGRAMRGTDCVYFKNGPKNGLKAS